MDFYFDENLPKAIAEALNIVEGHRAINRVFSTEVAFEKGIKDLELIPKIKSVNGILITHDIKMKTRSNEHQLIKEIGVTVFIISLPSGCNYELMYQKIFSDWEKSKLFVVKINILLSVE